MAGVKASIIVGRFVVFALMFLQCVFLASYPAYYEDENNWYAVILLFAPAALLWFWIISINADFEHVWIFWMLYIWLGVVPLIGIVFGRTGDEIESKGFWNGNTLKMTLCITPLLHFLIFRTDIATTDRDADVTQSSKVYTYAKAMLNLFDGIELLAVILAENEYSHGISVDFKNTLIGFTCISFLWGPVGMMFGDNFPHGDSGETAVYIVCFSIQVLFDMIFLGLRLGLCIGYGTNISIFINKNIVIITVFLWRILNFCCGAEDLNNNSTANEQQGEPTAVTATPAVPQNTAGVVNRRAVAPEPTTTTAAPLPHEAFGPPPAYSP